MHDMFSSQRFLGEFYLYLLSVVLHEWECFVSFSEYLFLFPLNGFYHAIQVEKFVGLLKLHVVRECGVDFFSWFNIWRENDFALGIMLVIWSFVFHYCPLLLKQLLDLGSILAPEVKHFQKLNRNRKKKVLDHLLVAGRYSFHHAWWNFPRILVAI